MAKHKQHSASDSDEKHLHQGKKHGSKKKHTKGSKKKDGKKSKKKDRVGVDDARDFSPGQKTADGAQEKSSEQTTAPCTNAHDTIAPLSDQFYFERKEELAHRVGPRRYRHIDGVATTALELARTYGVDERKARLAGLLHDWDKGLDDKAIRKRVKELGLSDEIDPWVIENIPNVLHGTTAARALKLEYPDIPDDVLQAIDRHTTAAIDMTPLDMVLYIADAIEPSRQFGTIDDLRKLVGEVSLEELFQQTYEYWIMLLFERKKPLHPDTVSIWNAFMAKKAKEGSKK